MVTSSGAKVLCDGQQVAVDRSLAGRIRLSRAGETITISPL